MRNIEIIGQKFEVQGKAIAFSFEELFTDELFAKLDSLAPQYSNDSNYVNELYLNFIQPYLACENYVLTESENQKIKINAVLANYKLRCFLADIQGAHGHIQSNTKIGAIHWLNKFKNHVIVLATAFFLLYRMFRVKKNKSVTSSPELYLARTKASQTKFAALDVAYEIEDYSLSTNSIYSYYSLATRLAWVFSAWIKSYGQMRLIKKLMTQYVGKYTATYSLTFYAKRLVHTMLYEHIYDRLLKDKGARKAYTGNNLDRFALIEEKIANKLRVELICIPHGLEYGFRFPKGFTGNQFFTSSAYAAEFLNKLYSESKFVFDEALATTIFSAKHKLEQKRNQPKVIFFTEPREVEVNHTIIQYLIPKLQQENIKLSLKLHPKDDVNDYKVYELALEANLEDSLQQNICFARKSTTLLEATYNESAAAAILINAKDKAIFNTFPSLQDPRISQFFDLDSLVGWIQSEFKKEIISI